MNLKNLIQNSHGCAFRDSTLPFKTLEKGPSISRFHPPCLGNVLSLNKVLLYHRTRQFAVCIEVGLGLLGETAKSAGLKMIKLM